MCSWILVWASGCHCQTICFFFWICQTIWLSRNELVAKANNSSWGVKVASAFDWGDEIKCFNPCYIRCWLISSMMKIPNTRNTWEITIIRPHLLLRCGPGPTTTFISVLRGAFSLPAFCFSWRFTPLSDHSQHKEKRERSHGYLMALHCFYWNLVILKWQSPIKLFCNNLII